ncbi:MAG: hypothetical protein A3F90_01990 [Deltaproteobacteria bacterium RIFCSPLOWO2_12_FULL_60_19]|nr:MAG: hypothetical protein A3F90_01990 [Deltaproteobacteria bacterium RIFCSPLOWO2_12_FULL_60_19]
MPPIRKLWEKHQDRHGELILSVLEMRVYVKETARSRRKDKAVFKPQHIKAVGDDSQFSIGCRHVDAREFSMVQSD